MLYRPYIFITPGESLAADFSTVAGVLGRNTAECRLFSAGYFILKLPNAHNITGCPNLNAPLLVLFHPSFPSVNCICRSATIWLCCFVLYGRCSTVSSASPRHLVPHRQHTIPIINAVSSASSRISTCIVTIVTRVLFTRPIIDTQGIIQIF